MYKFPKLWNACWMLSQITLYCYLGFVHSPSTEHLWKVKKHNIFSDLICSRIPSKYSKPRLWAHMNFKGGALFGYSASPLGLGDWEHSFIPLIFHPLSSASLSYRVIHMSSMNTRELKNTFMRVGILCAWVSSNNWEYDDDYESAPWVHKHEMFMKNLIFKHDIHRKCAGEA
jgi:hypothetical protein